MAVKWYKVPRCREFIQVCAREEGIHVHAETCLGTAASSAHVARCPSTGECTDEVAGSAARGTQASSKKLQQ